MPSPTYTAPQHVPTATWLRVSGADRSNQYSCNFGIDEEIEFVEYFFSQETTNPPQFSESGSCPHDEPAFGSVIEEDLFDDDCWYDDFVTVDVHGQADCNLAFNILPTSLGV